VVLIGLTNLVLFTSLIT